MEKFISEAAQERLIRENADASGQLDARLHRDTSVPDEVAKEIPLPDSAAASHLATYVRNSRPRLHNGDKSPYFA